MNVINKYPSVLFLTGTFFFLGWTTLAYADTANWTVGSGNYDSSSNWDISAVPCVQTRPETDGVVIPASAITVTQNVSLCSIFGLTLGNGATFNLLPGTEFTAVAAEIAATLSGAGKFTAESTQFTGPGAYVFGTAGADISLLNAINNATDTRFTASSGAVLNIEVDTVVSTGVPNSSLTFLSATGAGSLLQLPTATELNAAFNSSTGSVQFHEVVAEEAGVIDLSAVTLVTGPTDDEDYLYFGVDDTALINLDNLETVSAGGYVYFNSSNGATLSLPSLQNTQDAVFIVDTPNSQILANASDWSFSSTGRPNSNTILGRAVGFGALVDLSGMSVLNVAFNSSTGSVQFHQFVASDGGEIDLSGVIQIIGPADDEDYLNFAVHDTASINLDNVETVSAGGYVLFNPVDGATLSLPSLQSAQDVIFVADQPDTQILANATSWTFSSTERPNSNSTWGRATGVGALVDLSGMTLLNAGFNSSTGSVQWHQFVASNGGEIDLSGVIQIIGPTDDEDYLNFSVHDTASINLDNVETVSAGGYVLFNSVDGATLSLPSLQSAQDVTFVADQPDAQILANATSWTFSSTERPNSNSTWGRATGVGALVDLSGMTLLNAGFNSSTGSVQWHQFVASDGGEIDLSGVTQIIGPADDEDYLNFAVHDTASINLDNVETVSAGGYVQFNPVDGATLSLPSLQSAQDVTFVAEQPDTQILANATSWTFSSTERPNSNSTWGRATGVGALVDLSGMTLLNAGFNSSTGSVQFHQFVAEAGGVIDLSGVDLVIGPTDAEDRLELIASSGGTLILGPLDNVTNNRQVLLTLSPGGIGEFPLGLDADSTLRVSTSGNSAVSVSGDLSFDHTIESQFNLELARVTVVSDEDSDIEIGSANQGITPSDDPNFGFAQLIVGSAGQPTTARLVDVVDNGNGDTCGITGLDREALYLYGFDVGPDDNGLRILNGSTLKLGGLDLYAGVGGVLMHVNPWLTPGVPFPYDEGFIELGTPFDIDEDGIVDGLDNCVLVFNPDQIDTDSDGYGNACDGDLNGDLFVNNIDLAAFVTAFLSTDGAPNWNPDADFNTDGVVNFLDFSIIIQMFLEPPGPACPIPISLPSVQSDPHRRDTKLNQPNMSILKNL